MSTIFLSDFIKLLENMAKLYYNLIYQNIRTPDERIDRKEIICSYEEEFNIRGTTTALETR